MASTRDIIRPFMNDRADIPLHEQALFNAEYKWNEKYSTPLAIQFRLHLPEDAKNIFYKAFAAWEMVANVKFFENVKRPTLSIYFDDTIPAPTVATTLTDPIHVFSHIAVRRKTISLHPKLFPGLSLEAQLWCAIHELGHALNLEHGFRSDPSKPRALPADQSTTLFTVMNYDSFVISDVHPDFYVMRKYPEFYTFGKKIIALTPMPFDIDITQRLYGAPETGAGDTRYSFKEYQPLSDENIVHAVYDVNGTDIIDATGCENAVIDLNPGPTHLSTCGRGHIVFSHGTFIEQAIGCAGKNVVVLYKNNIVDLRMSTESHIITNYSGRNIIFGFQKGRDHISEPPAFCKPIHMDGFFVKFANDTVYVDSGTLMHCGKNDGVFLAGADLMGAASPTAVSATLKIESELSEDPKPVAVTPSQESHDEKDSLSHFHAATAFSTGFASSFLMVILENAIIDYAQQHNWSKRKLAIILQGIGTMHLMYNCSSLLSVGTAQVTIRMLRCFPFLSPEVCHTLGVTMGRVIFAAEKLTIPGLLSEVPAATCYYAGSQLGIWGANRASKKIKTPEHKFSTLRGIRTSFPTSQPILCLQDQPIVCVTSSPSIAKQFFSFWASCRVGRAVQRAFFSCRERASSRV